jgi:RNA polymerase sigma factor (sigma-70 family)
VYDSVDRGVLEVIAGSEGQVAERELEHAELRAALSRIDQKCRNVLALRYFADVATPELAAQLGYRANSVGKITSRCIGALTRQMCRVDTRASR